MPLRVACALPLAPAPSPAASASSSVAKPLRPPSAPRGAPSAGPGAWLPAPSPGRCGRRDAARASACTEPASAPAAPPAAPVHELQSQNCARPLLLPLPLLAACPGEPSWKASSQGPPPLLGEPPGARRGEEEAEPVRMLLRSGSAPVKLTQRPYPTCPPDAVRAAACASGSPPSGVLGEASVGSWIQTCGRPGLGGAAAPGCCAAGPAGAALASAGWPAARPACSPCACRRAPCWAPCMRCWEPCVRCCSAGPGGEVARPREGARPTPGAGPAALPSAPADERRRSS